MKKNPALCIIVVLLLAILPCHAQTPTFEWARPLAPVTANSGIFDGMGRTVATDSLGNSYAAGIFYGTVDFDPGPGVYTMTTTMQHGVYIMKLDSTGNFVWAKQLGDTLTMTVSNLSVTPAGNLYITGGLRAGTDFDPGPGVYMLNVIGFRNPYVLKLDLDGNFVWAHVFNSTSGTNLFYAFGAADRSDNFIMTAHYGGTLDADPGPGVQNIGGLMMYNFSSCIIKLDPAGNLVWAKNYLEQPIGEQHNITTDYAGNVFFAAQFNDTIDFDPGPGVFNLTTDANNPAVFLLKLNAAGDFQWVKKFGSANNVRNAMLITDAGNNIILSGAFSGTMDLDPGNGVYNLTVNNDPFTPDPFVVKLNNQGNFIWARSWMLAANTGGFKIATDPDDAIYLYGKHDGTLDLDPGPGFYNDSTANNPGPSDMFVLKLNSAGNFSWAVSAGGTGGTNVSNIYVDREYQVYTSGNFSGNIDFDPGAGVYSLTAVSFSSNMFFQKLKQPLFVGLPETNPENAFVIYPNPGTGIFNLVSADAAEQVTVFDMQGREVFGMQPQAANVSIDLRNFSAGIYSVHLRTARGTAVKRIVLHGQ